MDDYQKLRTSWTMLHYPDQPVVAACEQAPVRQWCNRAHLAVVLAKLYRASAWYA
jgi:hypothetical protein